jgi:dihydrofolate reductase
MEEALDNLQSPELKDTIENVWIVGGNSVYKEAMKSSNCYRIYLTRVFGSFECDTFFPSLTNDFIQVPNDADISSEVQEENGIKYQYQIYEKKKA